MLSWLAYLIEPLKSPAFMMWSAPVSWAELFGFITGGVCVALTVRRSVLSFPAGIVNAGFFLILFATARLWADASLQLVFIGLGFIGWWRWRRGDVHRTVSGVRSLGHQQLAMRILAVAAATAVLYPILLVAHDAAPFLDAVTTSLSLMAQWLLNGKWIQTWFFWIAADIVYIPLYLTRGLTLTAVIYALFLGLCVLGLREWSRDRRTGTSMTPEETA